MNVRGKSTYTQEEQYTIRKAFEELFVCIVDVKPMSCNKYELYINDILRAQGGKSAIYGMLNFAIQMGQQLKIRKRRK